MKSYRKFKEIFYYSDSEPNEVLIALCHIICLPASLIMEFHTPNWWLLFVGIFSGAFQLYAVLFNCKLKMRLIAVQVACLIAFSTCINLMMAGLMKGSRTAWILIFIFAVWNCVRVFREMIEKNG